MRQGTAAGVRQTHNAYIHEVSFTIEIEGESAIAVFHGMIVWTGIVSESGYLSTEKILSLESP